jgi:cell division ATPase FtsA
VLSATELPSEGIKEGGILGIEPVSEAVQAADELKRREHAGPPAPSVSLAAKQDVLEQSSMVPQDFEYGHDHCILLSL